MKKNIITAVSTTVLLFGLAAGNALTAQIYMTEEDFNERAESTTNAQLPGVPQLDVTYDQYTPLGGGALILGCLGGAYLIGKRKKEK